MKQNAIQDEKKDVLRENVEKGKRQRVILVLFLLAVISVVAFFVLRLALDRIP